MSQSLREVLASLDVNVEGLGSVDAANAELDRYIASLNPVQSELEQLRVKQLEASEAATRLAQRLRRAQKAKTDNAAQVAVLRGAYVRATEEAKRLGVQIDVVRKKAAGGQGADIGSMLASGWARAGVAMAGVGAVAIGVERAISAIVAPIQEVIGVGAGIEESANRMSLGAEQYQRLQFIAERTDVPVEALGKSFQRLAQVAAAGGGELEQLGVRVRDSNGELRSQDELFQDTVAALGGIRNETARAAAAQKIFGRSGRELLGMIGENPEKLAELSERFGELGGGLSGDLVDASGRADDAFKDMDLALLSLKGALMQEVVPAVADVVSKLASFVGWLSDVFENSSAAKMILIALAGAAGAFAAAILVPLALVALPFILLALAIDDVMTAFQGGDSILSRTVEWFLQLFGVTTTFAGYLDNLGVGWEELEATVLDVIANISDAIASSGLGQMLGIDTSGIRESATGARVDADVSRVNAHIAEALRQAQRAEVAQQRRGTAKTEARTVTHNRTYNIHSQDAPGVRREIEAHDRELARDLADARPLAEPA